MAHLYSTPWSKRLSTAGHFKTHLPNQQRPPSSLLSIHLLFYSLFLLPFHSLFLSLRSVSLSTLLRPLPSLSYPTFVSLPSLVYGGVVNTMSFLSLSAVWVASAGDELPVDNFVFAEHSDSQCGVIPPELATCENSPFGSPLLRWVFNP